MSVQIKKILKFSILTALLVFFMYLAFRGINFSDLLSELGKTNYFYAVLGTMVGAYLGSWVRALRWKYFLEPLKENISVRSLFSAVMIGYMVNAIIPKGGEVSRPILIAKKENISRASTFGTIVVERIFDVLNMLVVFGLCLFIYREKISLAFGRFNIEAVALWASLVILLFVIAVVIMLFNIEKTEKFVEKLSKKFLPVKFQDKINKIFISLINGFLFIKYPKNYLKIFALTILLWICYVLSVYITFFAFNIHLNFIDANLVLTMMTFAQTLPLPGNSAGTFHLFASTTLVTVFSISREVALGFATVSHLLGFVALISIGFYYSVKENYKFSQTI